MSGGSLGAFGYLSAGDDRWTRVVRGTEVVFRELTTLAELAPLEQLQREVMGSTELDTMPANALIVIPDTGGAVLAAEVGGELAGALWGFGGFFDGRPRIVSDWMGVRAPFRSLGLGAELKRLQAALALAAGVAEIVWTVDPLRAANARLNVAKLGATSRRYEVDRYGAYAEGLYGTMPTDRLHLAWDLRDPAVTAHLGGEPSPAASPAGRNPPADQIVVPIPADIDRLLAADPDAALAARLRVREQIQSAFAAGYVLDGHRPARDGLDPAHVLTRRETR